MTTFSKHVLPLFLIIGILGISGCQKEEKPAVGFYYWKTSYRLSQNEKRVLQENNVQRIYIRYFDVALSKGVPIPVSPISFDESPVCEVVPVVYIKNEVLASPEFDSEKLSRKTAKLINDISAQRNITYSVIQLDCDWTQTTKNKYFDLIERIRKVSGKTLTSTIRLHQIKYLSKTGVPPVEKGVLMYYNMGKIGLQESNSIYDRNNALKYLMQLRDYPIQLDVALPIYSWAVHLRNNKVTGLVNKTDGCSFVSDSNFVMESDRIFRAKNNIIKTGRFFAKNDIIIIESISEKNLLEMCSDIKANSAASPQEVIFFDLDEFNFHHHDKEKSIYLEIRNSF